MDKNQKYVDEITLQEIAVSSAQLILWLKAHFFRLLFVCALFAGATIFWALRQPEQYHAELSFILNDDNNPQISGISGMLGQLGIPVSGGKYNVDKLLEIAKSNTIVEATLLENATFSERSNLLANHFIQVFDLDFIWAKKDINLKDFRFVTNDRKSFSSEERSAIKKLLHLIVGSKKNRSKALFTTDYGKTDYIMSFSLKSPSEALSVAFVNQHFQQVSQHYVDKAIAKNQELYNRIVIERDSLFIKIKTTAIEIARLKDRSSTSFRNTNNVRLGLLESELRILQVALEETIKTLGIAKHVLDASTPLIQLLDEPSLPLRPQRPSVLKYGLFGLAAGVVSYMTFLFFLQVMKIVKTGTSLVEEH